MHQHTLTHRLFLARSKQLKKEVKMTRPGFRRSRQMSLFVLRDFPATRDFSPPLNLFRIPSSKCSCGKNSEEPRRLTFSIGKNARNSGKTAALSRKRYASLR